MPQGIGLINFFGARVSWIVPGARDGGIHSLSSNRYFQLKGIYGIPDSHSQKYQTLILGTPDLQIWPCEILNAVTLLQDPNSHPTLQIFCLDIIALNCTARSDL
jgi:hypothetical protein